LGGKPKKKESSIMHKKRFNLFKFAAFLLAIAPFTIENSRCMLLIIGEPKLPAKYDHQKNDV
jgi:hypothetical protein